MTRSRGFDIAIFSAGGATSREWAPRFAAAGAIVIDNSSAWRMDPQVPLVVSEVNPHALRAIGRGIVANPNCTTMAIMPPLKALHDAFVLREFVATSFQAAGGAGQKGMDELAAQIPVLHAARERLVDDGASLIAGIEHKVHAAPLAFNVVPWLGSPAGDGYTDEEMKLVNESRKILDIPDLAVSPTCVRVPVMVGHSVELRATFEREPDLDEAIAALEAFPNVVVDPVPDARPLRRSRRGCRGAPAARPLRPALAQPVRRRRQPPQGRRAERGPDRGDPRRAGDRRRARSRSPALAAIARRPGLDSVRAR